MNLWSCQFDDPNVSCCLFPLPSAPKAESMLAAQVTSVEEAEAAVQEALRRLQEAQVSVWGGREGGCSVYLTDWRSLIGYG